MNRGELLKMQMQMQMQTRRQALPSASLLVTTFCVVVDPETAPQKQNSAGGRRGTGAGARRGAGAPPGGGRGREIGQWGPPEDLGTDCDGTGVKYFRDALVAFREGKCLFTVSQSAFPMVSTGGCARRP